MVPQDVYLFNISLRDNIRLGRPDATDDEVAAAAHDAAIDDFCGSLTDGYDTVPGEFGAMLSGGQRQRIALARAVLKDAPVLVMDEAVSNLDTVSERQVSSAMDRVRKRADAPDHRAPTVAIRSADQVIVLEDGRVVATGRHEEVLTASCAYRQLVQSQLVSAATHNEVPPKSERDWVD